MKTKKSRRKAWIRRMGRAFNLANHLCELAEINLVARKLARRLNSKLRRLPQGDARIPILLKWRQIFGEAEKKLRTFTS